MSQSDWKTLWEMDRDHFIHPYTDFSTFREQGSQIISSAEGVHVVDSRGNRLLDGMAGLWCVNIGHPNCCSWPSHAMPATRCSSGSANASAQPRRAA